MRYIKILIGIVFLIFLVGFVTAENFGYNYLEGDLDIKSAINYSTVNVNDSNYLGGYDSSEFWLNDGSSTATGDWDLGSHSITTASITTPTIKPAGASDVLSIHPDATGADGAARIEFFKNADATDEQPGIRIYGYDEGESTQKYTDIYMDRFGRLSFGGTQDSTAFNTQLDAQNLRIKGTTTMFFTDNQAGTNRHATLTMFDNNAVNQVPVLLISEYYRRNLDFSAPDTDIPRLWLHDGSATAGNMLQLWHDTTDGRVHANAGDLKLSATGGNIDLGDDSLRVNDWDDTSGNDVMHVDGSNLIMDKTYFISNIYFPTGSAYL
ncbi:MAG: hypothetical protein ACOC5T_08240, partial [Elusimicrobiota bacterium]